MTSISSDSISIAQVRADLAGQVIGPADPGYDEGRAVFLPQVDRRPAVIVRPADAAEVAHVVALARESGLELAVRSGGHSSAGHGVSESGIVLDLSLMKALAVDHGELVVLAMVVHAGPTEDGERAVAPFRSLATPIADLLRPMPYPEIYPPDDPDYRPRAAARTLFLDSVDSGVAGEILDRLAGSTAQMPVAQLRVLGGAMARVPAEATAFAHRTSRIMANVAAVYATPEEEPVHEAWVTEVAAALRQADGGAYVNFLADEGEERIRAAYPGGTWDRLATVKHRYDPDNLFRLNQNIPPIPQGSTP